MSALTILTIVVCIMISNNAVKNDNKKEVIKKTPIVKEIKKEEVKQLVTEEDYL